jgi:competence protein ComGC
MGAILIKVPQNVVEAFELSDEETARSLLNLIAKLAVRKHDEKTDDEILGIWKDRFGDESAEEVGRRWRREMWTRK